MQRSFRPAGRLGRAALWAFGIWLALFPRARAEWILQESEPLETSHGSLVRFVRKTVAGDRVVEMHLVFFDTSGCDLRVIDHPGEQGDLDSAMRENHCIAGVNGSYFHPDRTPLGLVIADGREVHPLERAKLLSGILTAKPGHFSLVRYAEFAPDRAITQALQSGPFLVDRGEAVPGLEPKRRAERTVVLSDGKGKGALLVCRAVSLAEMAAIISTPGVISEMHVHRALNLDGGSSTGLWVATGAMPFYRPELSSVRTYLALLPRSK